MGEINYFWSLLLLMRTEDFYNIIDVELDVIIGKYKDDAFLVKNKTIASRKAYALLIWFIEFYGKKPDYVNYITDGDGDSSCDIVFDNYDNQGKRVFYIVQSKWNVLSNCNGQVEKKDILQALNDFDTILSGRKEKVNDKLKSKIAELQEHLKSNGDVKFLFLSLCNWNNEADDNIRHFVNSNRRTKFEQYDINKLKYDYIERNYKKIDPLNPLDNYYNPEESKITLNIQRINAGSGNFMRIEKPFIAYVFLIKPRTIFDLFEKYGFQLFDKNVRNPLIKSEINQEIEQTTIDNPAYFWYYNNGITAISNLIPEVRDQATSIEITGLQVINGAQTVYSIYKAYKEASPTRRDIMDSELLVSLRLLKSGGKDFDLKVTRYTNSQNLINDRDFKANDDVQIRLQQESFSTKYWYEKRRGEFREVPKGVYRVWNGHFANAYLAVVLQDPVSVIENRLQLPRTKIDFLFVSHREHKDGMYERIFNNESSFAKFLVSARLTAIYSYIFGVNNKDSFDSMMYHTVALSRIVLQKYINLKVNAKVNLDNYLISMLVTKEPTMNEAEFIAKVLLYTSNIIYKYYEFNDGLEQYFELLLSRGKFEALKSEMEDMSIDIADIDSIVIPENNNEMEAPSDRLE